MSDGTLRYLTARELLFVIQESQPKLDLIYTNRMDQNTLKFIGGNGFILVPSATVQKIINDEYLKSVFDPALSDIEGLRNTGFVGTLLVESKRKSDKDIFIPVFAPAACDIDFNSSHDYNVFLTPEKFDVRYSADHPFATMIGK